MSFKYDGSDLTKGDIIWPKYYEISSGCWAAVRGDNGSAWKSRFMNFAFKIND